MKHHILYSLLMLIFSACVQDMDIPFPQTATQVVLNGMMHPDSLITLQLTETLPLQNNSRNYPPVENASVQLFEDGQLLEHLEYIQDGLYSASYYPLAGKRYTVHVVVPGYQHAITASDIMPARPEVAVCLDNTAVLPYTNWNALTFTIRDAATTDDYYWIEFFRPLSADDCVSSGCDEVLPSDFEKIHYFFSKSPLTDKFNAYYDNTSDGYYHFDSYVRLEDTPFDGEVANVQLVGSNMSANVSQVINGSQTFDQYMKSSLTEYLNYQAWNDPNPFVQIGQIYSNVAHGTGIFAAYNSVQFTMPDVCSQ